MNGNIRNSVNLPDVSLNRMGVCRLCVIHRNIPGMINRILDFITAENINVEHMINKPRESYAYTIVDRWFRRGRPRLPDVVFFTDDYVAQGGLLALLRHGIRIPEDVAVVSFANKGHLPIWYRDLTRIEIDPAVHGTAVSQTVQKFLRCGQFPKGLSLGSVWMPGDTF